MGVCMGGCMGGWMDGWIDAGAAATMESGRVILK